MRTDVETVTETYVRVELTVDEARAAITALSYFNMAVGGDNFQLGYRGEEAQEDKRHHRMARSLQVALDKAVIRAERKQ